MFFVEVAFLSRCCLVGPKVDEMNHELNGLYLLDSDVPSVKGKRLFRII